MKVSTMRLLDKLLGVVICFILTVWRNIADRAGQKTTGDIRRVVFIKLAEQGATVLAYPAVSKAAEMVGRDNVFFVVFEDNRFILDVLEVIPQANVITISHANIFSVVLDAFRAVVRLRKLQIDAAMDFEFFSRSSAALSYLSAARVRVGFHAFSGEAGYRGDLMTHRLSFNSHLHTAQIYQVMVDALKVEADKLPAFNIEPPPTEQVVPGFQPGPDELNRVQKILSEQSRTDEIDKIILLNANCGDLLPLRRWPGDNYIELSRLLIDKYPQVLIVFTGSPAEAAATKELSRQVDSDRCICLAGKTTLRELLVLYCLSDVLVTNDSGPAHFAALTPIDVVVLFGPETPELFAAQTPRTHVLWSQIVCSPCVNAYNGRRSACRDNLCMQRITVEQVFKELCRIYDARQAGRL